ncbi:amino acid adenylation domain-containing protein [Nocardia neocaledoniensis]|uniref:non-ribosomal peptide synthetase n=1 Tax=Nocardia neocaledoniensis TaxID=236511 RepID=UPI00245856F0|nr:amino acid adenylation domain-containing protein [Nocardia neocaledoniensis]
MEQAPAGGAGIDRAEIRAAIARQLDLELADLADATDLIQLGLDSIRTMKLAGGWRKRGIAVNFALLAAHPTVDAWHALLNGADPEELAANGTPVDGAATDEPDAAQPGGAVGVAGPDGGVAVTSAQRGTAAAFGDARPAEGSPVGSGDEADSASAAGEFPIVPDDGTPFALAPMQHAYWIGRSDAQELGGVAAHLYVEFDGAGVEPERLERAVEQLLVRHPMLRTRFLPDGTQQTLDRPGRAVFSVADLRADAPEVAERRLAELRNARTHQKMAVQDGQVIDIALTRLADGRTRLHLDVDMLAADAMSYRILITDLARLYHGEQLAPQDYTFRQYLADHGPGAAGGGAALADERARDRAWWQARLPELPGAPELPQAQHISDPSRTVRLHRWLSPQAKARVFDAAHARGITPAMALASVFAETIGGWSAQRRFLLNLPLFHREPVHPQVDGVVGDFTSSVLLEVDVTEPATVADRARALQQRLHEAGAHSAYSGLEVLRDLGRHRGEPVLAPIVYTSALNLGELFADTVTDTFGDPVWIISQGPQVLLDAQITEVRGGLLLNWDIRESAFPAGMVEAMFARYIEAIERLGGQTAELSGAHDGFGAAGHGVTPDGSSPATAASAESTTGLVGVAGRHARPGDGSQAADVLGDPTSVSDHSGADRREEGGRSRSAAQVGGAGWQAEAGVRIPVEQAATRARVNATAGPVSGGLLHTGFFANAATNPSAPAVLWEPAGRLTYGELATDALAVAGALREAGVAPGDSVAVQLPKGPDQVLAVLGVLAAGAVYVPIGFDQPAARRAEILRTADAVAVLTVGGAEIPDARAIDLAEARTHAEPLARPVFGDPENVAYVLFTSGSTGKPKGVEVPHRAAMNTIDDLNERFALGPADRALALSALEFDLSVYDIFGLLAAGGAVVAVDDTQRADPARWVELIRRHEVSLLNCVPSLLDMLLTATAEEPLPSLRTVILGGDWVDIALPGRLAAVAPECRFAGLGGATETAIHSTICEVVGAEVPAEWSAVPYGTPLRNVRCRVVGPAGNDCPDWVTGELWIGGDGVAAGYRKDPERTADRFVTHEGLRWYRTGDLARYLPDGALEFLGRADHQVKIRGYRVELGEVESALRAVPGIRHAVAAVVGSAAPKLVAAVVPTPDTALDIDQVLAAAAELVPAYMVPTRLELLPELPLTSNAKPDRKAVRAILEKGESAAEFVEPRTDLERALAAVIGEVLATERIGVTDDFFALGGDSVLATTAVARIREWLDAPDTVVADLFTARTVAGLAARMLERENESGTAGRLAAVAVLYLEVAAMSDEEVLAQS